MCSYDFHKSYSFNELKILIKIYEKLENSYFTKKEQENESENASDLCVEIKLKLHTFIIQFFELLKH